MGAVTHILTIFVDDGLGLFKAMAGAEELTLEELARRTNSNTSVNIRIWIR